MAEKTIPILPCSSIDEILAFYRALGFAVTFQQQRPNPYAVVERGGIRRPGRRWRPSRRRP